MRDINKEITYAKNRLVKLLLEKVEDRTDIFVTEMNIKIYFDTMIKEHEMKVDFESFLVGVNKK